MQQDSIKWGLSVEISSGQMVEDVRLAMNGYKSIDFLGEPGSRMITAEEIADYVLSKKE
jgi:2-oxoglutarate ferredoxin oxidoreductase subunit alpha